MDDDIKQYELQFLTFNFNNFFYREIVVYFLKKSWFINCCKSYFCGKSYLSPDGKFIPFIKIFPLTKFNNLNLKSYIFPLTKFKI